MADVNDKIESFFAGYRLNKFRKGQVLLLSGDKVQYVYHIVSGVVKQYDVSFRGDEVILNLFKPPAFFPMSNAMNDTVNNHIYEAETDVELHKVPVTDVVAFIRKNPDVLYDLLSRVYRGLDGVLGRMSQLMAGSADTRLAHELIVEGLRFGKPLPGDGYAISLSEKDLGARAGLTRETVSRQLTKLKKVGLIQSKDGSLIIKSMPRLQEYLSDAP